MEFHMEQPCDSQVQIVSFWALAKTEAESLRSDQSSFKTQDLPLARIKKIMKLDDEVQSMMISAEAPILFAKAAELFIRELTLRAWIHTERNRRRTLQRNDIAMAVSDGDTDQFDFLIDIVPRDEARGHRRPNQQPHTTPQSATVTGAVVQQPTQESAVLKPETIVLAGSNGSLSLGAAGGAGDASGVTVVPTSAAVAAVNLLQQQQPGLHFATLPAGATTMQALSASQSLAATTTTNAISATVSSAGVGGAQNPQAAVQPIQYVFQLPMNAATAGGQPFQIQMLPQHFQVSSADGVNATPGALMAGPSGGLQVVQVVSPHTAGLALPVSSTPETNGSRVQTVQLQLPDLNSSRPTLLLQPSGAVVVAGGLGGNNGMLSVDGQQHQLVYASPTDMQSLQQILTSNAVSSNNSDGVPRQLQDQSHQLLLTVADSMPSNALPDLSSVEAETPEETVVDQDTASEVPHTNGQVLSTISLIASDQHSEADLVGTSVDQMIELAAIQADETEADSACNLRSNSCSVNQS